MFHSLLSSFPKEKSLTWAGPLRLTTNHYAHLPALIHCLAFLRTRHVTALPSDTKARWILIFILNSPVSLGIGIAESAALPKVSLIEEDGCDCTISFPGKT